MTRNFTLTLIIALTAAFVSFGCSKSREQYLPKSELARDALQRSLENWKAGAEFGPITHKRPTVNVFDARWRDGKKLESFEITEEVKNTDQPEFKVRLKLVDEPEETDTYLVIGIEPLNVFRDVDYKNTQSM